MAAFPNDSLNIVSTLTDDDYRRDIAAAISPVELSGLLREKGLITESESNQYRNCLPIEYAEYVLKRVLEQGETALSDFIWCLKQSGESHLGHKYAIEVLHHTSYDVETLSAIMTSTVLKQRFQDPKYGLTRKTRDIDVLSIFPYLLQKGLLTDKEQDELRNPQITRRRRYLKLERMLENKGPLAYWYFTKVLIESMQENPNLHQDILMCLFGDLDVISTETRHQ